VKEHSLIGKIFSILVMLVVLALDFVIPPSITGVMLYGYVALVALWSAGMRFACGIAAVCSFLTVAGLAFSPAHQEHVNILINRALAIIAIWTILYLALKRKRLEQEKEQLHQQRETALTRVLGEFVPLCAWCKRVRDEEGDWQDIETYITVKTDTKVSHGICPECLERETEKAANNKK
jgi:hypothetical protein